MEKSVFVFHTHLPAFIIKEILSSFVKNLTAHFDAAVMKTEFLSPDS